MLTAGTARATAGEKDAGRLAVGEYRDGSPIELPVAVINGRDTGKTLYVQAVSDGDELNGLGVVRRVVPRINPEKLTGAVIVVGIVNAHGFHVAQHRNPIDDIKLNRVYPGCESGTSSERLTARVYEVAKQADYIIDLHQGSTSRMLDETRVRCGRRHRLHDNCLELAKTFNCGHVLDRRGPEGQLARVAPDDGIPTIDPELGGCVGWDDQSIRKGVQGVFNVLKYYDFYPGSCERPTQVRARGFSSYTAPTGGLVSFRKELGEQVKRGDTLFDVTDVFGKRKGQTTAEQDGVFWRARRLPQVASGEYVCSVGTRLHEY